jgi:ABC-type Fe3+/spermidine/putrescine transport system ATPase subunit
MSHRWIVEGLETQLDQFHLGPVDLALDPGHAVAVLGMSGAGKTTLLRTLAGFLKLKRGRILRDGVDISDWPPEERELGYVPQGLGLLPHRTVLRNIRFPLEIRGRADADRRAQELVGHFRLGELAGRYPSRLSGGEQQRVAIARALAADPGLIVWDEPWQGLDVLARYELGLVLHELRETQRIPMVIVTHDPALAFSIADSFLVLSAGHVREQCDALELLRAPVDAFVARFLGFENVFERSVLESGSPGSFRTWLLEHAGPEGVAFPSPTLLSGPGTVPGWAGKVRSARPSPHGLVVEALADNLVVTLRLPPPVTSPLPAIGAELRFRIEPATVHPLGTRFLQGGGN